MFNTLQSKIVLAILVVFMTGLFGSQIVIHTDAQIKKGVATLTGKYKEYSPEILEKFK